MPRNALTWTLTLPLVGLSVLVGHAVAYAVTGTDPGDLHGYLDHVPQVVALLVLVGLLGLAAEQRSTVELRTLPYLGLAVFAVQEHLERYVHTGHVPFLLTNRTFLLGLALQIPIAIIVARVTRRVIRDLHLTWSSRGPRPRLWTLPEPRPTTHLPSPSAGCIRATAPSRGPPRLVLHVAR